MLRPIAWVFLTDLNFVFSQGKNNQTNKQIQNKKQTNKTHKIVCYPFNAITVQIMPTFMFEIHFFLFSNF